MTDTYKGSEYGTGTRPPEQDQLHGLKTLLKENERLRIEIDDAKASHKYELAKQQSLAIELEKSLILAKKQRDDYNVMLNNVRLYLGEEKWLSLFGDKE